MGVAHNYDHEDEDEDEYVHEDDLSREHDRFDHRPLARATARFDH